MEHRDKAQPSLHKNEDDIQPSREDWSNRVHPVLEWQEVLKVLLADGATEIEGCNADVDPRELVQDTNYVL